MSIKASDVMKLRKSTGVGMMECKKALLESSGDLERAVIWLREKGLAKAAKKSGRDAAEGLVTYAISATGNAASIIELNCETDFTARNTDFQMLAKKIAEVALAMKIQDLEKLKSAKLSNLSVAEELTELITKIGENMNLRRVSYLEEEKGLIFGYNHMQGKIGSLVVLKGANEANNEIKTLGLDVAMHVAASAPKYLDRNEVPSSELEQEAQNARKRLEEQGKPDHIIEKAVPGQLNRYYIEVCLLDQPFVKEPKKNVTKYLEEQKMGLKLSAFIRYQLGEGIEISTKNFAEEVHSQL